MKHATFTFLVLAGLLVLADFEGRAQTLQPFTLPDLMSGKNMSLADFKNTPALAVIFTNTKCPYDAYYANRIRMLANTYKGKVTFIFVDPQPEDGLRKEALSNNSAVLPYLLDKAQGITQNLGATKTPEAFLLQNNKGTFSVVYSGQIDSNPQVETDVESAYLELAIEALLDGEAISNKTTRPIGCSIRTP